MNNIHFEQLTMRNFLSYGNSVTTIDFDKSGTTLILGEDLDNTAGGRGANGVGKALTLDSDIKTPYGWIKMRDINVNDIVSTPDGGTAPVVGVFPQGKVEVFKVTFSDGRSVEACGDHLWNVFSHRWGGQFKRGNRVLSTRDIIPLLEHKKEKNKAWYNIFVPLISPSSNDDCNMLIPPYLLGALIGAGGLTSQQLTFTNKDEDILKLVSDQLSEYECTLVNSGDGVNWRIEGAYKSLSYVLTQYNLLKKYSYEKEIPPCLLDNMSVTQKHELLAGLFDTDGTVTTNKNISFSTSSEQLAKQVQYLIRSLGGKASISSRTPFCKKNDNRVYCRVSYKVSIQYKNQHCLFHSSRKLQRLSDNNQYSDSGLRIVDIIPAGKKEAQCIMVDHPDHLFITNDFIVTHNTTILNALSYVLYDKPVSKISKDNLINNINKKNMLVTVTFSKGSTQYIIERARKTKEGNYVKVLENGVDITRDSISNTDDLIESIINIPYELFVIIVVFSAARTPFLDLSSSEQTAMMEHLFSFTEISEKADNLKETTKETTQLLKQEEIRIDFLIKEHARHEEQLVNAERRIKTWDGDHKERLVELNDERDLLGQIDFETEIQNHTMIHEYNNRHNATENELKRQEKEYKDFMSDSVNLREDIRHLEDHECPYCKQHYEDITEKLKEKKEELNLVERGISMISTEIANLRVVSEDILNRKNELSVNLVTKSLGEASKLQIKASQIDKEIDIESKATNPHVSTLEELKNTILDPINYEKINELNRVIEHQKFLQKILTKKDSFVRKVLLDKNLPFLNKRLQEYLLELGLHHKVEFTPELTVNISSFGREMDFGNLSNGQRARVNIALSLAFRDVLQKMHTPINIVVLDEILDVGLDSIGIQSAAKLIKHKAKQEGLNVYIISHRDEVENMFDSTMVIQMSQGFSYVKDHQKI